MSVMQANVRLERILSGQLSAFNDAYLAGKLTLEQLADLLGHAVVGLTTNVNEHGIGGLDSTDRERVMTTLGFVTGTMERHAQSEGRPMNAGIGLFPGYERMLLRLAGTDLPLRDTARTFWMTNRAIHGNAFLTYTSDRGERFFNRQVCELNDALTAANDLLRTVIDEATALTAEDAELLAGLPGLVRRYKTAYSDFRRRDNDGLPITPEFFTFVFRTFLPAVEIAGETWHGPNAAWLASVFSFDSLFGTAAPWYRLYSLKKVGYLTANERATVTSDLAGLSITDLLAASLHLPAGLASVPSVELAARLRQAAPPVAVAARYLRDTWLELVKGTKGHETLVRDFLDRPSAGLSDADIAHMAVKPAEGTGGGTRDLLADIGDMRKSCIPARALVEALRLPVGTGPARTVAA